MHKAQRQVQEFHKAFNYPQSPADPQARSPQLRADLIMEEAIETVFAFVGAARGQTIVHEVLVRVLQSAARNKKTEPDLVEAIDGLCDLLYVTYGSFEDIGVDGEPFFDEVHRSNMAKVGGPCNEVGKKMKPDNWTPPDIESVLVNTSPPPRENCGCDGAFDDGCFNCTKKWRCSICRFPLALVAENLFCAHCAKMKLTAPQWNQIAFTGKLPEGVKLPGDQE
jgi:predicted HAD superfamily Cof-like phosphohydrolase